MNKFRLRIVIVVAALAAGGLLYVGFPTQRRALFGEAPPSAEAVEAAAAGSISPYDLLMRQVGKEVGLDWRLLAAVAHTESNFDPAARSYRGARGLMQIMPSVAEQFGVPWEEVADPLTNIRLGGRLLSEIYTKFYFPARLSDTDRLRVVLAAYNAGVNHLLQVRRTLAARGVNYNDWGQLKGHLPTETVGYVGRVVEQYERYQQQYR